MADPSAGTVAVTLGVAPALEERVVDWLLARPDVGTFTSGEVHRYGVGHSSLSVAEQVSGRQRRVALTIEVPAEAVATWLEEFAAAFAAMEIDYRVTPVLLGGNLRRRGV